MSQPTATHPDNVNDDNKNESFSSFPFALLALVAMPLVGLVALGTYLAFAVGKIRISVLTIFGFIPSALILLFFWEYASTEFLASFTVTLPAIFQQQIEIGQGILTYLKEQLLLSIPLGLLAGIIYSAYRWYTRPVWVETKFRLTPFEVWRKKRNIKNIKADKATPMNGMTLGVEDDGKRVVQTFDESRAHTLVIGASGAGKTRLIESRLRDAIKNGQGAIIVDLKGGKDLPETAAKLAHRYDKKFQHWLMQPLSEEYHGPALNGPAYYDPIGRGEATRRKDLLIEARKWSEEHYKIQASFFLQLVMSVIVANPRMEVSTLSEVVSLLDPKTLQQRAIPLGVNPIYSDLVKQIDSLNDEKLDNTLRDSIKGLASQFGVLLNSVAGPWVKTDPTGKNNINLFRAAHEGEIVIFSLDSSNYPDQAALIANLIIQDLKTVSSELRGAQASKPFQVIIDEFSAIGSDNIVGLINKSRDANMPVTLTTQALGDLRQNSETLQDQILGIVNSFIIQRANKFADAEELAGLSGKVIRKRFSESVTYKTGFFSKGSAVGQGNIEDVEEYGIMPQKIQALKTGEFYYINKSPMRITHGFCIMEDEDKVKEPDEVKKNFVKDVVFNSVSAVDPYEDVTAADFVPSTPGQIIAPPMSTTNRIPTLEKSTPVEKPTQPSVQKPLDMDRLRKIMNQDPSSLLPKTPVEPDSYKVVTMPTRVAPELQKTPTPPPAPVGVPQLPSLPKFPKPSTSPAVPGQENKLPDITEKTTPPPLPQLPNLPSLPGKSPALPPQKKTKDEFDF